MQNDTPDLFRSRPGKVDEVYNIKIKICNISLSPLVSNMSNIFVLSNVIQNVQKQLTVASKACMKRARVGVNFAFRLERDVMGVLACHKEDGSLSLSLCRYPLVSILYPRIDRPATFSRA